ncbi:YdcF family protein [Pseudonocardia sp. EC080625-04]|uniref:YdcF family protein n=1 Tax=Pseudonocardia sp. EC080625-04 TaxID=1096868 RepID=UPI000760FAEA|nr:YdcF family protein [Pseudonocardia sp. EC080625-04]
MSGGTNLLISVAVLVVPLVVTAVVCTFVVRRVRREPRRLSNAYWLLAAAVLLGNAVATLGFAGSNPVLGTIVLLTVTSPLLALVFAVFLILNGAVMLRRERVSLRNSLSLLAGLLIVVLLAVAVPVMLTGPVWLRALWILCALAAYFLAFQFVAFLGYARLYRWLVRDRPADWVVVLGSGLHGSAVPPLLADRIRAGMTELDRRGARMLVLSGGKGDDERLAEGEAMRRWAVDHGADPALLRAETASRTTEQNLRLSDELVRGDPDPAGPGLIVTSDYHVFRAAVLARRLGVDAQAAGAPTAGYYWPSAVLREFVAILREHRVVNAVLLVLIAVPAPLALLAVASG